jgi:hypothetical protein
MDSADSTDLRLDLLQFCYGHGESGVRRGILEKKSWYWKLETCNKHSCEKCTETYD